jgi:hypothetical protein
MSIRLLTRQDLANTAYDRWHDQYGNREPDPDKDEKTAKLAELNLTRPVDPEKVNEIIGNTCWTHLKCDSCGSETDTDGLDKVVIFDDDCPDPYENDVMGICSVCLTKANKLWSQNTDTEQQLSE